MGLETYIRKRNFSRTPEPKGKVQATKHRRFVVQEHHASHLHFDFRLEIGGVLKSWSIPKGPSLDPGEKRLAVTTEDHPIAYLDFEGHIAEGNYGAGDVRVWDIGEFEPVAGQDPEKAYKDGKLSFVLQGDKLRGEFHLIRTRRDRQWLLIKSKDEFAESGWTLKTILPANGRATSKATRPAKAATARPAKKAAKKKPATVSSTSKSDEKPISAATAFKAKKLSGDIKLKIKSHIVALTNLDKVYWPDDGYTKGDLLRYYYEVAATILPYLKDRPLIIKRYPSGITKSFFYQHDVNDAPDFAPTIKLNVADAEEGHEVDYLIGGRLETLLYAANLGAIEQHPWLSRTRSLDRPDWIVFDLDPDKDVRYDTICKLAVSVRDVLKRFGLDCYAKTSGSRGMHIYIPIKPEYSNEQVADFAERVAGLVAQDQPEIATIERSLKKRKRGQIYVDHMQNARGKSVAAPYSVRPRPGAMVSAPLTWREVESGKIRPQDFTIKTMAKRIARKGDLFAPVLKSLQSLKKALKGVDDAG